MQLDTDVDGWRGWHRGHHLDLQRRAERHRGQGRHHLSLIVLALAACQQRTEHAPAAGSAAGSASPPLVSVAEPAPAGAAEPAPPPPRAPAPPLPATLPGKRRDLSAAAGKAYRAAIADLDGDGHPELAFVDGEAIRIVDRTGKEIARAPVTGGIDVLTAADLDGDHHAELLAGWGQSRDHMDAKLRVTLHRLDHASLREEQVIAPTSTRQNVTAIIPQGKNLLVAYFDSKYTVTKVTAKRAAAGWTTSDPITIRMATAWAVGEMGTVVGRLYGDAKGVDGDAFILAADGTRKLLPTTRGVQGLAVVGTDIFVGDGWHQNYADRARGLLTWLRPDGGGYRAELIEDTPGQFAIFQIVPVDLDGDGKPELVTRGSNYVRVYKRTGEHWKGLTIGGLARDICVGDLDGTGNEVFILGDHSEVVDLHGVAFE